jgi:Protein of unknown function (DUF3501)
MMSIAKTITGADIIDRETYSRERKDRRSNMIAVKKVRRMEVGPYATFHFESRETMLAQIQEMLWIENGGEEQLADELAAYNPLVPNGRELVATLMFEIPDEVKRDIELRKLAGVEDCITIKIGEHTVTASPEIADGVERTKDDGKTSAVHFLHFPFSDEQASAFQSGDDDIILSVAHRNYGHLAIMAKETQAVLAADFD